MINFGYITKENIKEHNLDWTKIRNHSHRILMIVDSGSRKRSSLFNLIRHQADINEMSLNK